MSGVYNETYFKNRPDIAEAPGILYCVVLVNKKTLKRECLKIGIAKGTNFKDIIKRSKGFTNYDIRIQKTYVDTLYNVWNLEQFLHTHFAEYKYKPSEKFGGHTECFEICNEIIQAIPSKK